MKKVCVVYASMTGNTEEIANILSKNLEAFEVEQVEMEQADAANLLAYDGILLGSYTWGDGELPGEAEDFFNQLDEVDLTGKIVGVFGSGDTVYEQYCAAVDQFQEKVKERGATIVGEGLKIELSPDDDEQLEKCNNFAKEFTEKLV